MSTTISLPLLSQVQIASPCPAKWADMKGDDTTRFCAECSLHVHNISNMKAEDAEAFLSRHIGADHLCIQLFRRADGTILTQDCPVGLARLKRHVGLAAKRVGAAVFFLCAAALGVSSERREQYSMRLREVQPFRSICEWLNPTVYRTAGLVCPLPLPTINTPVAGNTAPVAGNADRPAEAPVPSPPPFEPSNQTPVLSNPRGPS